MPIPMNETLQVIANRHSIRVFQDTTIPNDVIEAVLNAANLAPSAHNQQSWRFFVISGNKKKNLVELVKDEVLTLLGEPQGEFMAVIPAGYPERETKGPGKKPLNVIVKYIS